MGVSTLSKAFDPSRYTEHQAVNLAVDSTSLETLMSVTGKGMLEEALLLNPAASSTNAPELKITKDGIVIIDLVHNLSTNLAAVLGIYQSSTLSYDYSDDRIISGWENLLAKILTLKTGVGYETTVFPSPVQTITSHNTIIGIEHPIYFNSSLLIQVKGATNSGAIQAVAKARY